MGITDARKQTWMEGVEILARRNYIVRKTLLASKDDFESFYISINIS
jgi:hypothetical protein